VRFIVNLYGSLVSAEERRSVDKPGHKRRPCDDDGCEHDVRDLDGLDPSEAVCRPLLAYLADPEMRAVRPE